MSKDNQNDPGGKDTVYALELDNVEAFAFDAGVADVFQDMISRSVPGYELLLQMIGLLTDKYAQPQTNCYDLGCSLGASTLQIKKNLPRDCHAIGVDNSAAMVERCRANLSRDHYQATSEVRLENIQDTEISNASIVVLNFTLQFIPDAERLDILKRIAEGLVPGGILLLAEKLTFADDGEHELMTDLHLSFKKFNGYSDLEIAQKRAALENVLVPNTLETHLDRLASAGFTSAGLCVRALNFVGILAVK